MTDRARIELVPAKITDLTGQGHRSNEFCSTGRGCRRAKATESHYLRLVAANGQILATSELYANKANAKRAAQAWLKAMGEVRRRSYADGDHMVEVEK